MPSCATGAWTPVPYRCGSARPGEWERWRIVNACTSRFLRLRLDGHRVDLLATDIGRLAEPRRVEEVEVLNSGRVDVLVTVGGESGELQGLADPRTRDRDGDGPSGARERSPRCR